jgi:hypothetical protein
MTSPFLPQVRHIVADVLCVIPETVNAETALPEHNTASDYRSCQSCLICEALDLWGIKLATVGDIVRFLEAREAEGRG